MEMTYDEMAAEYFRFVAEQTDEHKAQGLRESFERVEDTQAENMPWQVARAFLLIGWKVEEDSELVQTGVGLIRTGMFSRGA